MYWLSYLTNTSGLRWSGYALNHDIERIQKSALKVIFKDEYQGYEKSLKILKMESLYARRERLSLRFVKKCLNQEKLSSLFPKNMNESAKILRNREVYHVNRASTERYRNSAIPFLQRKLNESINFERKQRKALLQVNCVSNCWLYHFMKIKTIIIIIIIKHKMFPFIPVTIDNLQLFCYLIPTYSKLKTFLTNYRQNFRD